jgi:hypothetical protein
VTSPVTVTLTPTDGSGSGISTTKYCVDTANTCNPSTGTTGTSVSVTCASGVCRQYVRYAAWDVAGNASAVYSKAVRQDKQIPVATDDWTNNWTATTPVTVTITPADIDSGISTAKYCTDIANTCTPTTVGTSASLTCASGSTCTQYVRYASWDNVGNASSIYSETARQDLQAPTNPTLTATAGNTQVSLSWITSSDTGSGMHATTPYKVVFATGATAPANCSTGTQIYLNTGTSYIHTGLTNGTQYSYRACALDAMSNMSAGTTASATPFVTTYTVTIQPSTKDCYLYEVNKTTNYGVSNNAVGVQSIANSRARGLVSFNFSASVPAGATITAATLSMYAYNVSSGMPIVVSRMLHAGWNDWVESEATWNNYKNNYTWTTAGALNTTSDYTTVDSASANCPASVGWMSWNVQNQVQTARDSVLGVANFLLSTTQTTGYVNLYSRKFATTSLRPKLYIEYQFQLPQSYYALFYTNSTYTGNLGGRSGADTKCNSDTNKPSNCTSSAWAFIGVNDTDRIIDMPTTKSVNTAYSWWWVKASSFSKIGLNWADLLDSSIMSPASSVGFSGSPSTGSFSDGYGGSSYETCTNWTSSGTDITRMGSSSSVDGGWLQSLYNTCSAQSVHMCACLISS